MANVSIERAKKHLRMGLGDSVTYYKNLRKRGLVAPAKKTRDSIRKQIKKYKLDPQTVWKGI